MFLKLKNIYNFILHNISFKLNKGEILSILGHNGSGKTTLLKVIMGLLPIDKGEIFFEGKNIEELKVNERADIGIGYIFQEIPEYVGIKVKNYVKGILKEKFNEDEVKNRFNMFGLDWDVYKERNFDQHLSGGEKKKIEIIVTLLLGKKLYLLDEVENSLDATSRVLFKNWIKDLSNNGTSFIIVSHNEDLIKLANNGILLCNGKIEDSGKIDALFSKYVGECKECSFTDNCQHVLKD